MSDELTYAAAGVDTAAGDKAVELMKAAVSRTHGPQVIGGVGAFAGLYDASALKEYRRPLLASSTDGVGTKVAIAQQLDKHDTIGIDLVAMVVDDIVVCGAKPLVMTDYIATGKIVPSKIAGIVSGIAKGCELAQTALVGGETAEHPGLLGVDEYDVAGAAVGVVEADHLLGAHRVVSGDVIISLASSGLHSNGYSLVRAIIKKADWELERNVAEFGRTLGEELLEPTKVYSAPLLDVVTEFGVGVHAISHVTGGGLAANVARVIPNGLAAVMDRTSWVVPPVFSVLQALGNVPWDNLEDTLNMGSGMVVVVAAEQADAITARLAELDLKPWTLGYVAADGDFGHNKVVRGAKGVDAGASVLMGDYQL